MKKNLLVVCILIVGIVASAQVRKDPRTLTGLKKELLPPVKNMQEIKKHAVPGGVLRGAQYVGKAECEPMEITAQGTADRSPNATKSPLLWKIMRSQNGS